MKAVFLQARIDSSRLPAKALYMLGKKTIIEYAMENLEKIKADFYVLVTDEYSAQIFLPILKNSEWQLFIGSKLHVLERFVMAARHFKIDYIIRATGDNPLVDAQAAQVCLDHAVSHQCDHVRMDGLAYGAGVEIAKVAALELVYANNPTEYESEHVCPGIWQKPEIYKLAVLPSIYGNLGSHESVTVDTYEDYEKLNNFAKESEKMTLLDYLSWKGNNGKD